MPIKGDCFYHNQNLSKQKSFENVVGIKLKEYSAKHFVLASKGIRVVFIETDDAFGI